MANVERGHRYRIVNAKSGTVLDLSAKNGVSSMFTPFDDVGYLTLALLSRWMEFPRW
jgi:hypothetical protein